MSSTDALRRVEGVDLQLEDTGGPNLQQGDGDYREARQKTL